MAHLRTRSPLIQVLVWLPAIGWAVFIFALSATPNLRLVESDPIDFIVRKAGHMAAFGILALLSWGALSYSRLRLALPISFAMTVAYAASDELHQSFTAGRHPSPVDVGIDSAGEVVALLVLTAWLRLRSRRTAEARPDHDLARAPARSGRG